MRIFNAFASTVKLVLSGYHQNGGLIMRDILETAFLLDLFSENHKLIKKWRFAGKDRWKEFSPAKVRKALDLRDGFTSKKRAEHYGMFSELAGHPSMNSVLMMRPERGGDAVVGPSMEKTSLEASLGEMGRLAILAGEILDRFFPTTWQEGVAVRVKFARIKSVWIARFYPKAKSSTTQRSP